jgi:hypothetical protein
MYDHWITRDQEIRWGSKYAEGRASLRGFAEGQTFDFTFRSKQQTLTTNRHEYLKAKLLTAKWSLRSKCEGHARFAHKGWSAKGEVWKADAVIVSFFTSHVFSFPLQTFYFLLP